MDVPKHMMFWEIWGLSTKSRDIFGVISKSVYFSVIFGSCRISRVIFGVISVTNQNFYQNSHCRSETKIAKTLLAGTKLTYDEKKKTEKREK